MPLISGNAKVAGFHLANIKAKEIAELRRKLGVVFQDFRLLADRNVYENLAFVLKATGWKNKSEIESRIVEVLDMTGVTDKIYKMPHQLSGGEQQRVVIARAVLNDPPILLADEPTGNLDTKTSLDIMSLFEQVYAKGNTIIVVTHEEDIARYARRVVRLRDGLVESDQLNDNPVLSDS